MAKTITNAEIDTVVSYMTISFDYSFNIILPYKDGVALLACLERAEAIDKKYSGTPIKFIDKVPELDVCTISQKEYREQKMIKLLGVHDDEPKSF
jgi:hypothetical protein